MADYSNDEPAQKLHMSYSGWRITGKKIIIIKIKKVDLK